MDDHYEAQAWLARIAPLMKTTLPSPQSAVNYDLFADGLKWSDEIPAGLSDNVEVWNCLRVLWRFRTSLILGQPQEKYRWLWEAALQVFPTWTGFLPQRRDPSLKAFYDVRAADSIRAFQARCDQEECAVPTEQAKSF